MLRPLCSEVCARTKAEAPEVRAKSLRALTSFAERLGSVFETSMLQDALPYMAECLEGELGAACLAENVADLLSLPCLALQMMTMTFKNSPSRCASGFGGSAVPTLTFRCAVVRCGC